MLSVHRATLEKSLPDAAIIHSVLSFMSKASQKNQTMADQIRSDFSLLDAKKHLIALVIATREWNEFVDALDQAGLEETRKEIFGDLRITIESSSSNPNLSNLLNPNPNPQESQS